MLHFNWREIQKNSFLKSLIDQKSTQMLTNTISWATCKYELYPLAELALFTKHFDSMSYHLEGWEQKCPIMWYGIDENLNK